MDLIKNWVFCICITIIVSVILTTGVSGIFFLSQSFAGVSLAMVFGVILNLILKEGKKA